jgi:hypothetical protein
MDLRRVTREWLELRLNGLRFKFNSEVDKADRYRRLAAERDLVAGETWDRLRAVEEELSRRKKETGR